MSGPDAWRCPWCHYHAPTKSMRDQHLRECPFRPKEPPK